MYFLAAIICAVITAESVAEELYLEWAGLTDTPASWNLMINFASASIFGIFGNRWYLWHAKRQINRVRAMGHHGSEAKHILAKRGGTSFLGAVGIVLLCMFFVIVVFTIIEFLRYGAEVFHE